MDTKDLMKIIDREIKKIEDILYDSIAKYGDNAPEDDTYRGALTAYKKMRDLIDPQKALARRVLV